VTPLTSLGSPFAAGGGPAQVTPLVPFASSFAKLEIAKRGFVLGELFTLRAISNGINIGPKITRNNFPNHTTAPTLRSGSGYTLPNNR
jgi:hypothetical protein